MAGHVYMLEDGRVIRRTEREKILTDHGTISAGIICMYAPKAELCSLKVFNFNIDKLQTSINQLLAALEWCYQQKIPIIHMSLGSTLWMDYVPLRRIAAKLVQNGQMLIAAHSNSSAYTMPACFMGVLGVETNKTYQNDEYHIVEAGWRQVQIQASSRHKLVAKDGLSFETPVSNSYAAPVITAKIHEILCSLEKERMSVPIVYQKLAGQNGYSKAQQNALHMLCRRV
ncbi:MAG: S8 family serine peptidase [Ruminococcus sp.]|nr:S8 family serine peptidase [Ruminococcus sp.]